MAEAAIIAVLTAAATHITKEMINDYRKSNEGEQIWECWPDEAIENWRLIEGERKNDNFPQGFQKIKEILGTAYVERRNFLVKAIKKRPHWTWYYAIAPEK